ncbi:MAG: bifunctional 5,10-methylenetetrahydrofolate dehydrogenase/5,10-methenyltetrahydrofolate cyclohydrolase, partial [Mycoplasmataceae bacterium]|nr:bifunctional 5,10-methylenetetrahydrofolate dehydrogenase/5,10-methenyltetrahydrofolate cyclohydrolase [Mycoplasmataceae bacterium]
MLILDGKKVALEETEKLKHRVSLLKNKPKLGIIQVCNLSESNKYISNKIKKANEIGINSEWIKYDKNITENELLS